VQGNGQFPTTEPEFDFEDNPHVDLQLPSGSAWWLRYTSGPGVIQPPSGSDLQKPSGRAAFVC
jgi:hypothetical protein